MNIYYSSTHRLFMMWSVLLLSGIFSAGAQTLGGLHNHNAVIHLNAGVYLHTQGNYYNYGHTENAGTAVITGNLQQEGIWQHRAEAQALTRVYGWLLLYSGHFSLGEGMLELFHSTPDALQSTGGYLISENEQGKLRWHLGEDTGSYKFPFADSLGQALQLIIDVIDAGQGNGYIEAATYGTAADNMPLPQALPEDARQMITTAPEQVADRYWLLAAGNYSLDPLSKIKVQWQAAETATPNTINEDSLALSYWDGNCWISVPGGIDTPAHTFLTDTLRKFDKLVLHDKNIDRRCNDGSSCANAYLLTDADYNSTVFEMEDMVMWFRFNSIVGITNILIKNPDNIDSLFNLDMAELIQDSCTQTQFVSVLADTINNWIEFSCLKYLNKNYWFKLTQEIGVVSKIIFYKDSLATYNCGLFQEISYPVLSDSLDTTYYQILSKWENYFQEIKDEDNPEVDDKIFNKFQKWDHFWKYNTDEYGRMRGASEELLEILNGDIELCESEEDNNITWINLGPFNSDNAVGNAYNCYGGGNGHQGIGRVESISVNRDDETDILVGGNVGGIFRSTDGGANWTNTTDDEGYTIVGVSSIVRHPQNQNYVYATTRTAGEGVWGLIKSGWGLGVIVSTDGGSTWANSGLSFSIPGWLTETYKIVIDPNSTLSNTILYVTMVKDIMKWEGSYLADGTWTQLYHDPDEYPNANSGPFIYENGVKNVDMEIETDGTLWFCNYKGVWRVQSGSNNPVKITNIQIPNAFSGIFTDTRCNITLQNPVRQDILMTINKEDDIVLFVTYSRATGLTYDPVTSCNYNGGTKDIGQFMYRSTNSGVSWSAPLQINESLVSDVVTVFDASPFDSEIIYAELSESRCVVKIEADFASSTMTWNHMVNNEIHVDCRNILVFDGDENDSDHDVMYLGTDGGIAITTDGNIWEDITGNGLVLTQVLGVGITEQDDSYIFTGSFDGSINFYRDGEWFETLPLGDNGDCLIHPDNRNIVYQEANASIFRGVVAGNNVTTQKNVTPANNGVAGFALFPLFQNPSLTDEIFAGFKKLFVATNPTAPSSWTEIANPNERITSIGMSESNPDVLYYSTQGFWWKVNDPATNTGGIFRVERTGTTWGTPVDITNDLEVRCLGGTCGLPAPISDIAVDSTNEDRIWVAFGSTSDGNKVFWTEDGGDTWENITSCLPNIPFTAIAYQAGTNDRIYIGSQFGVFYKDASMQDWAFYGNGGPKCLIADMEINYCGGKLVVATQGRGLWEVPLLPSNHINPTLVITQDETWNTERFMTGDLAIKPGATLTIKNVLRMPKDGRIIVERGAKLIVDGGTITNSCGALWQGIEVWGNATKNQYGNYNFGQPLSVDIYNNGFIGSYPWVNNQHGVVLLINGAMIENAVDAVSTLKRVDWAPYHDANYFGGIVVTDNATFRNCKRAVEFMKFDPLNNSSSRFINTTFEIDGLLNGGARPGAFVSMWELKGVEFEACTFINRTPQSYLSTERGIGIITVDAYPKIMDICQQYNGQGGCSQYSDHNVFQDLHTGVRVVNTYGRATDAKVANNLFINNFYGVDLQGAVGAQVYKNYIKTATMVNNRHSVGINGLCSYNIKLEENEIVIKPNSPGRGIYFEQSHDAQRVYKNKVSSTANKGFAFSYGSDNSNLVNECNTVDDAMYHFMVFDNSSIFEKQGDCMLFPVKPAGNIFDPTCNNTNLLHFYTGLNAAYFEYCDGQNSNLNGQCVIEFSPFRILTTPKNSNCPSEIIVVGDDNPSGFYGKRSEQEILTGLIKDQYALLDGGKTKNVLDLVHNESYSANQLKDTLLYYTPFLSDDVLLALLFRNEFSISSLSHILIENAPHSNLIWKAIAEINPPFNADSLEKLIQYQDSTSARKYIIDSMNVYKLQKSLIYSDMLYIASVDTNYSEGEVKDSLKNEKDISFRLLLGDLHMRDGEYYEADTVYNTLKVYFREDKQLMELREIQTSLFKDTLTYFDLDSTTVANIEEIAFNDTSIAAFQAMGILEFLRDTIYTKPYHDIASSGGSSKTSFNESNPEKPEEMSQSEAIFYKLFPTMIVGKQIAFVSLASDEDGYLQLYRIEGNQVGGYHLNAGTNQIQLSELNLSEGIHIYRIYVNGELKKTGKIIKLN